MGIAPTRLLISSVPWFALVAVPPSRPAPSTCDARRRVKAGPLGRPQGLALMVPSTARCSDWLGRSKGLIPRHFECSSLGKHSPGNAGLLASAIASTLWCRRFFAASIHDLSP